MKASWRERWRGHRDDRTGRVPSSPDAASKELRAADALYVDVARKRLDDQFDAIELGGPGYGALYHRQHHSPDHGKSSRGPGRYSGGGGGLPGLPDPRIRLLRVLGRMFCPCVPDESMGCSARDATVESFDDRPTGRRDAALAWGRMRRGLWQRQACPRAEGPNHRPGGVGLGRGGDVSDHRRDSAALAGAKTMVNAASDERSILFRLGMFQDRHGLDRHGHGSFARPTMRENLQMATIP